MAEIYRLVPCDPELPEIIVSSDQLNVEVSASSVICLLSELSGNICYTVFRSLLPPTTTENFYVNQIFEDCISCTELCTTPINNVKLVSCDGTQPTIIVPASSYNYSITPLSDTICLNIGDYQKTCYRVSYTQEPTTSQQIIVPSAFYADCPSCAAGCFYKFYTLQDCNTGELYLGSNGQPIQYFYDGTTSTYVTSLGGIDFLTSVVLTNIYNSSKVETAKGCLKLVEIDYVQGQSYTSILNGIDNVFFTDTCLQCKLKSCGDCNTLETENVNCKFADEVYRVMLSVKYGLETCCDEDLQKWIIKKELVDLTNLKHTYIKCCAECSTCTTSGNSNCNCNSCNSH